MNVWKEHARMEEKNIIKKKKEKAIKFLIKFMSISIIICDIANIEMNEY